MLFYLICSLVALVLIFYHRLSLSMGSLVYFIVICLATLNAGDNVKYVCWINTLAVAVLVILNVRFIRKRLISRFLFSFFKKVMPAMSRTEREAIEAGSVWWEKELFSGNPNWQMFDDIKFPALTAEELAFLLGPVEELCAMINDWEITHVYQDLPKPMWDFLKSNGFFSLLIPKQYGGKGFSALLHSEVIAKVAPLSCTVASTITVPNSLGPAELLLHYGTEDQKTYYLPRLASGEDIPCFALTGIESGSDAANMKDYANVCKRVIDGKEVLGFSLTINKRYITLAPIATVIGVAFLLYDPDKLLGDKLELGVTCALIPRRLEGLKIGKRHFPLNIPFQNGPISCKNVFVPIDTIIGGIPRIGQGWLMLMQCLAEGRSISLPSMSAGSARVAAVATGAYARIRRQFNCSLSQFDGVQEKLGRMAGLSYTMEAMRKFAASGVNLGHKSGVLAAIVKYHNTELARTVFANDAMDIHGGKAICMGPSNYLARSYQGAPIAITVEGANILTRCLIIYGQGSIRCHPYVFTEITAADIENPRAALTRFDIAIFGHIGFVITNFCRSFILALTNARLAKKHGEDGVSRYYQLINRYSASLAILSDLSMIFLGGKLKRLETLSARLGDILSYLFITTAVLKQYTHDGAHEEDLPIVKWACHYFLYQTEQSISEFIANFPSRPVRMLMKFVALPDGVKLNLPSDHSTQQAANLLSEKSATRMRIADNAYLKPTDFNIVGQMEKVLADVIVAEPLEKKLRAAVKSGIVADLLDDEHQIQLAVSANVLSQQEAALVRLAHKGRLQIIAVDSFTNDELKRRG